MAPCVAPDWSADWLHREAVAMLELQARADTGAVLRQHATRPQQADARRPACKPMMRDQHLRRGTRTIIVVSDQRAQAISWWPRTTRACSATIRPPRELREAYAMKEGTVPDAEHRRAMTGVLLLDRLGRGAPTRPGYENRHLHQQLAVRTADRQHADLGHLHLVGVQRPVPDRRHRPAGLALRAPTTARKRCRTPPANDPLQRHHASRRR